MARRRNRGSKWRKWLTAWAVNRRRRRLAMMGSPGPLINLMSGLVQFYIPEAGATHLRSWGETEALPADPYSGIVWPSVEEGTGTYMNGQYVQYLVYASRSEMGRVFSGSSAYFFADVTADNAAVRWPPFNADGWTTEYLMVREFFGFIGAAVVPAWQMQQSGWVDTNSGWETLDFFSLGYTTPPAVARALWVTEGTPNPAVMDTAESMFGGAAFDSSFGQRLVRQMSEDLRRSLDGTLAVWVHPVNGSSGCLVLLRAAAGVKWQADYSVVAPSLWVGSGTTPIVSDHQSGDWYLLVMRNDTLTDSAKLDLLRVRDGARFNRASELSTTYNSFSEFDNYWEEGLKAVLDVGEGGLYGPQGQAHYDRIGVWDRPLTEDEVEALFNGGLGWKPE